MENKNILSDEEIESLYERLRPVVTVDGVKFLLKKYTLEEIKKRSFLQNKRIDKETYLDNSQIEIQHSYNYIKKQDTLTFNPTIGEILEYIPKDYLGDANAFEISDLPRFKGDNCISKIMTYRIRRK